MTSLPLSTTDGVKNVTDLQAVLGTDAAIRIGPGVFPLTFSASVGSINIEHSLTLRGSGRSTTFLDIYPKKLGPFELSVFKTSTKDLSIEFSDLTVLGPTDSKTEFLLSLRRHVGGASAGPNDITRVETQEVHGYRTGDEVSINGARGDASFGGVNTSRPKITVDPNNARVFYLDASRFTGVYAGGGQIVRVSGTSRFLTQQMARPPATNYGTSNELTLRRVDMKNSLTEGVTSTCGDGRFRLEDCQITVVNLCVSCYDDSNTFLDKHLWIDRCVFESGVPKSETVDKTDHGALCYLHPHVSLRCTRSTFRNNPREGIHQYSGGSSTGHAPKYVIITDCDFENVPRLPILTCGEDTETQIENCMFDETTGPVTTRSDVLIRNCSWKGGAAITAFATRSPPPRIEVRMANCRIQIPTTSGPYGAIATGPNWRLSVADSSFVFTDGPSTNYDICAIICGGSADGLGDEHISVRGCIFDGRAASDPATGSLRGIFFGGAGQAGHRLKVADCVFSGRIHYPIMTGSAVRDSLDVRDSRFLLGFTNPARNYDGIHCNFATAANDGAISGGGNYYKSGQGFGSGGAAVAGQNMELRRGRYAAAGPLAPNAEGVMYLDASFNTFAVAGIPSAPRVKRLLLGSAPFGHDATILFSDIVYLRIDEPLVTEKAVAGTAGGNIIPKTESQRSVGDIVRFKYEHGSRMWVEL